MRSLLIVSSYHHNNTRRIADAIAGILGATATTPEEVRPEKLREYDLVGFGSGIYSDMHHPALIALAASLPQADGKAAFIFSTSAIQGESKVASDHTRLRTHLRAKGYHIVGEFSCEGFNTNSFLKWFGGMNKGHPNAVDLQRAEEFARKLLMADG